MALGRKKDVHPSSIWRDKSALLRSGIVTAALALGLAGCGAVMPGGNISGGPAAPTDEDGPGVGDTVKVAFIGTDLQAVEALTGFKTANPGDLEAQAKAMESWVNANGGLGGKKMEAIYRLYDANTSSPASEEKLCNLITQDDKAFAVVMTGQYQTTARTCYANRRTLMFDAALVASDKEYYEELHPYLWSASYPEYGAFAKAMVEVLDDEEFFDGTGVGIVAADNKVNRRVTNDLVIPMLKDMGIEAQASWVDTTGVTTLFNGLEQAAVTFRGKKYGQVMFLGGQRMASMFATAAATAQYAPRFAMSSFDNPTYFTNNPTLIPEGVTEGMVGVGFHPPQELTTEALDFPNAEEKICTDIYAEAGITFENREAARVGLPYCDAVRMLKHGADSMSGKFNASNWADAIRSDGAEFQTASGFGNGLGTTHAAAGGYYVMRFDSDCGCFTYEGEERSFDVE